MSDRAFWDKMCEVIKYHNHAKHCCIDTINRLLRKNPHVDPQSPPQVSRQALKVSAESRSLANLWVLIHETQITSAEPGSLSPAVIVLRWNGQEYLMDGRRRINYWKRHNDVGPHRVLVLEGVAG